MQPPVPENRPVGDIPGPESNYMPVPGMPPELHLPDTGETPRRPGRMRQQDENTQARPETVAELKRQTEAMARALKVRGLMNVQFAVKDPGSEAGAPAGVKAPEPPGTDGEQTSDLEEGNRQEWHVSWVSISRARSAWRSH